MRKISSADPATKQFVKRAIHELLELNKQNLAEMRKQSTQKSKWLRNRQIAKYKRRYQGDVLCSKSMNLDDNYRCIGKVY